MAPFISLHRLLFCFLIFSPFFALGQNATIPGLALDTEGMESLLNILSMMELMLASADPPTETVSSTSPIETISSISPTESVSLTSSTPTVTLGARDRLNGRKVASLKPKPKPKPVPKPQPTHESRPSAAPRDLSSNHLVRRRFVHPRPKPKPKPSNPATEAIAPI